MCTATVPPARQNALACLSSMALNSHWIRCVPPPRRCPGATRVNCAFSAGSVETFGFFRMGGGHRPRGVSDCAGERSCVKR
jgi:hypothetical protein